MSARLQPKEEEEERMSATMQPKKGKKTSAPLQPKEEEKMAATMKEKKTSAPLQPKEEERMAATMQPKKGKRTSAPLQPKEEEKMAATMQSKKEKRTAAPLQPKEEENMAATMQSKKEKRTSAPLQPKEEERMAATMQPKKEKKTSAPLQPKKEKKASATCRPTLMNKKRTLAEVTFADAHRISTTVTHSNVVVTEWIKETVNGCSGRYGVVGPRQRHVVGLDVACQWNGYIALVQLCVGNRCLIYQPLHSTDDYYPGELFAFLNDHRFCFVAAGVEEVVYGLKKDHSFLVRNTADLRDMAATWLGREDLRRAGLERLAREVMGVEMDMPAEVRMSEWWWRDLSQEQIAYASAYTFVSFELGRVLFGR